MITENLPHWIGLFITFCTGIFFWAAFYFTTNFQLKKTQETVEELKANDKELKNMMHSIMDKNMNMDKNIALVAQRQEYIQENISILKDRVKELENNKVA